MVRKQQLAQLDRIKSRDTKVQELLQNWSIAKTGKGNLLEIAVDAARNQTTQISDAFYGRYKAQIKSFSGVYSKK
jgi:methylmalonyl-CoA mutase